MIQDKILLFYQLQSSTHANAYWIHIIHIQTVT